jgi:hypothetical protein
LFLLCHDAIDKSLKQIWHPRPLDHADMPDCPSKLSVAAF